MILDSFKLHNAITQITYEGAFELWDRAGAISRRLMNIWPDLKLADAKAQYQVLTGTGISLNTGFSQSTVTLSGETALNQRKIEQLTDTFNVWREALELSALNRVSTRTIYVKEYDSMKEANSDLLSLNLVRWPSTRVFDQPLESDSNAADVSYRFEDENSFAILRVKSEQVKFEANLDPGFVDEPVIKTTKIRMVIDFDRGLLGSIEAGKFRMDEWVKGYQHILRRDIEKVLKGQS